MLEMVRKYYKETSLKKREGKVSPCGNIGAHFAWNASPVCISRTLCIRHIWSISPDICCPKTALNNTGMISH